MEKLNGLKITKKLIKEGMPDNSEACPIALAMRAKVDGIPRVNQVQTMIVKEGEGRSVWINHTPELTDWIRRYDRGGYGNGQIPAPGPITLEINEAGELAIKKEE